MVLLYTEGKSTLRNSGENKICIRNHGSNVKKMKIWHDYNQLVETKQRKFN